jgi:hypothetical protein
LGSKISEQEVKLAGVASTDVNIQTYFTILAKIFIAADEVACQPM